MLVALLRGINVGTSKRVAMAALRIAKALEERLGVSARVVESGDLEGALPAVDHLISIGCRWILVITVERNHSTSISWGQRRCGP